MSASVANLYSTSMSDLPTGGVFHRGDYTAQWTPLELPNFDESSRLNAVALHGMVESPEIWRNTIAQFGPLFGGGFELSMPWHGDQGYLWGLEARPDEWLEPCLADLPEGDKIVFAHSFGANALLSLLQRRPRDDIRALILLSPYYKSSCADFTWELFRTFVNGFDYFVATSIRIRPGGESIRSASLDMLVDKVKEKYASYSWVEFYELYARTPTLQLDRVQMPVLVMGGDHDLSILPHDLRLLAQRLPNAQFHLLSHCGHFGMVEQPEALSARIHSFLSEIEEFA